MTVLVEIFKEIEGFEEYLISNLGTVISSKNNKKIMLKAGLDKLGYYRVVLCKDNKKYTKLVHKLVANAFLENPENKDFIDHIDNNPKNNNISNLRFATRSENNMNRKKETKRVTSSIFKGTSFIKSRNKWQAQIKFDGKNKFLGYFDFAINAARRYDEKAKELFGEFANTNF